MNYFGLLPCEIIPLILNHTNKTQDLYHCSLINKLFYSTTTPLLWRTLHFNNETSFTKFRTGLAASRQLLGQHIHHLSLGESSTDRMLLNLMQHIPNLETLKIENARYITDESLQHLAHCCPNLTTIDLLHVPITTLSVIALAQHCRRLCHLVFKHTLDLSPAIFSALAHCPLQTLDISSRWCGGDLTLPDWLGGSESTTGLCQLSGLTRLRIFSICTVACIGANVLRTATTTSTWPHLTHLILYSCQGITTVELTKFLKSHPLITTLDLNGLPNTTDAFTPVAQHLHDIEYLCLGSNSPIKPRALCHFVHQCPSLTYLCFWNETEFSKSDFPGVFDDDDDDA